MATTAVGLLFGLMVAIAVLVGAFGCSEVGVARAACAVEVACMATAVWLLSGVFKGSKVGVDKAACAVEVICATTCAFPDTKAAWVAFCEAV